MPQRDEVMKQFVTSMPMLRSFLYHLCRDWDTVDDAIQETAVWLCDHWNEFEGGRFNAWIRSVGRYRCYEARRKRRGKANELPASDLLLASIPDRLWDEEVPELDEPAILASCIDSLPPKQRQLLRLHYEEGHDASRIAQVLRSSLNAIYMAMHRMRKSLRECVDLGLRQERHPT